MLLIFPSQAQCPYISFVYADACDAPDGKGEFLMVENNGTSRSIDDLFLTVTTGATFCKDNSCDAKWYSPDVSNLNSLAGCGALFVGVGPGDTWPASSKLLIFTNRNFKDDVDWSNFCDQGTIYVLTIDKVNNNNKYIHNEGGSYSLATVSLAFNEVTCDTSKVSYDPGSMAVESPKGVGGGPGIAFGENGAAIYKNVGCEMFDLSFTTLAWQPISALSSWVEDEKPSLQVIYDNESAELHIQDEDYQGQLILHILDMHGKMLLNYKLESFASSDKLLLSELSAGMYWVKVYGSDLQPVINKFLKTD